MTSQENNDLNTCEYFSDTSPRILFRNNDHFIECQSYEDALEFYISEEYDTLNKYVFNVHIIKRKNYKGDIDKRYFLVSYEKLYKTEINELIKYCDCNKCKTCWPFNMFMCSCCEGCISCAIDPIFNVDFRIKKCRKMKSLDKKNKSHNDMDIYILLFFVFLLCFKNVILY